MGGGLAVLLLACIAAICFAAVAIAALALLPAPQAVSLIESVGRGLGLGVCGVVFIYISGRVLS